MARDVATMFDELKAMADRYAELHADRARLQTDVDRLVSELEQARRPWWHRWLKRQSDFRHVTLFDGVAPADGLAGVFQGFGMPLIHLGEAPEVRADLPQLEQQAGHSPFSRLPPFPMPLLPYVSAYRRRAVLRRPPPLALAFHLGFAGAHILLPPHYRHVTIMRNARSAKNHRHVTKTLPRSD
jgi:hypothetical protein